MSRWSTAHTFVAVGAAIVAASMFLPWVASGDGAESRSIIPIDQSSLRPALVILVVLMATGVVLLLRRSDSTLIGGAAALWLNATLMIWFAGGHIASVVPEGLLPEHVAVHLGVGAAAGLLGGLVLLAGCVLVLAEQTWNYTPPRLGSRLALPGLLLASASIAVRNLGWIHLTAGTFSWSLDFDAVPIVGDAMSVALFASAVLCLVTILYPKGWAVGVLAASALSVSTLSVLAFALKSLAETYGRDLVRDLPFANDPTTKVNLSTTAGPVCSFVLGLAIIGYCIAQWKAHVRTGAAMQTLRSVMRVPTAGGAVAPASIQSPADQLPF